MTRRADSEASFFQVERRVKSRGSCGEACLHRWNGRVNSGKRARTALIRITSYGRSILRRVSSDLSSFTDGREIPEDSFIVSLEFVYRGPSHPRKLFLLTPSLPFDRSSRGPPDGGDTPLHSNKRASSRRDTPLEQTRLLSTRHATPLEATPLEQTRLRSTSHASSRRTKSVRHIVEFWHESPPIVSSSLQRSVTTWPRNH